MITAKHVLTYWAYTRGIGHSELMVNGFEKTERFAVIVSNSGRASQLRQRFPRARILTVSAQESDLFGQGRYLPLTVEHDAMQILVEREMHLVMRLLEEAGVRARHAEEKAEA